MSRTGDFWSRRRAGVEAEQARVEQAEAALVEEAEQEVLEAKTDEELLDELKLPNPDEMTQGDDFSAFMSKAVPERLRRRALRKLWHTNPVLANLDGLIDYGEDYTDAAVVVANMQTGYQVGKGMLYHIKALEEQARQKAEQLAALVGEDGEAVIEPVVETPSSSVRAPGAAPVVAAMRPAVPDVAAEAPQHIDAAGAAFAQDEQFSPELDPQDNVQASHTPRRMQFNYSTEPA
ncbi:MAG: hypothetical protein ACI9IV_001256 [Paracoccaceae bacterium]